MKQSAVVACAEVVARRGAFTLGPISCRFTTGTTVLVGPNGAGKTTLLELLSGLMKPARGAITWRTRTSVTDAAAGVRGDSVGYLPQSPDSPAFIQVGEFLHMAAWLRGVPRRERDAAVTRVLALVDLSDRVRSRMGALSGGQRRRAELGAALVHRPRLLVLDEPMTGLDPQQRIRLRHLLAEVAATRAVIVSTHVLADVGAEEGRVLVLSGGRIRFDGSREGLAGLARTGGFAEELIGDTELERGLSAALQVELL